MSESRAASRYAKAVIDLAVEQGSAAEVAGDLEGIRATIAESESLQEVLASPVLKASDKESALASLFKGANGLTHKLFALLATNKRIGILDEVAEQYLLRYEEMRGQDEAEVITAIPLTAELEKKVLKQLKGITGKEVVLENKVDPALIGGFILRVGDLEYNASLAGKLENLKRELIQK